MMAVTGEVRNVIGKRIDMVPTGPIPGKTPISVPINTPMKQDKRLAGVRATEKP